MLFLELLIHLVFLHFFHLAEFLFVKLLFKLFSDESFALFVSKNGLLLLFVVEKSIELLDGSPLVILIDL